MRRPLRPGEKYGVFEWLDSARPRHTAAVFRPEELEGGGPFRLAAVEDSWEAACRKAEEVGNSFSVVAKLCHAIIDRKHRL
jgi:hypothetical protein